MPRRRKLYYDVVLAQSVSSSIIAPTLTEDRDGGLLEALPALDGNSSPAERQRQELSVFFQAYGTGLDLAFLLTAITPSNGSQVGEAGYLFRRTIANSAYSGPLVLQFTQPVDPDTLSVAYTNSSNTPPFPPAGPETMHVQFTGNPQAPPLSFAAVGSTIEITNSDGDDWGTNLTGADCEVWVILTSGLRSLTGEPLANPGRSVYWNFLIDD